MDNWFEDLSIFLLEPPNLKYTPEIGIKMSKEETVLRVLRFLKGKDSNVSEQSNNKFLIEKHSFGISLDKYKDYDLCTFSIDFNSKKAIRHSYLINNHNGDTFGEESEDLPWNDCMGWVHDELITMAKEKMYEEIFSEQAILMKNKLDDEVNRKLTSLTTMKDRFVK